MDPTPPDQQGQRRRRERPPAQFIVVSGQTSQVDAETRRLIRSHAQTDYRHRNPRQRRTNTVELEIDNLIAGPSQDTEPPSGQEEIVLFDQDHRARQLWAHLHDGSYPMFATIRNIGFTDIARSSALNELLSAASWHLEHRLGRNPNSIEHYRYSAAASRSLQQRLSDPATATTDEVITAVLAFAYYAMVTQDSQQLRIHCDGLDRILYQRGGLETLDNLPVLRIVLFWVDVYGCFDWDMVPRYPQPVAILRTRSWLNLPTCHFDPETMDNRLENNRTVSEVCYSLRELHRIIHEILPTSPTGLWRDPVFAVFQICPLLHDLLSIPHGSTNDSVNVKMRECFRLASILHLCAIRGKFGFSTLEGHVYGAKLVYMLDHITEPEAWRQSSNYLIWIHAVGASCWFLAPELRARFVNGFADAVGSAGFTRYQEVVDAVIGVVWCYAVFESSLADLESRVSIN
ncbi:hypothetical protein F5884DRAFT_270360 [Xylogone sp. PMI_703]|nr:hypothetical protein F5884DRAFT_270360 [Xylogone sp. PMI_703]